MKNRKLISFLLLIAICMFTAVSSFAESNDELHIYTTDDFNDFSNNCSYVRFSENLTVILEKDIDFTDTKLIPVPSFSGTFNGNGHTISGINLDDSISPLGLFRTLEKSGLIENLNVSGILNQSGDNIYLGGIVGVNFGHIDNCNFNGFIQGGRNAGGIAGINKDAASISKSNAKGVLYGDKMVGGIAGCNEGLIISSSNEMSINTTDQDTAININNINFAFNLDLSKLKQFSLIGTITDIGGITGYNCGYISKCSNLGEIGYPHVGYNIGGITGRNSGQIYQCINSSNIYGRKDVAGITGQAEPYVRETIDPSTSSVLKNQLASLKSMCDKASYDAQSTSAEVSQQFSNMSSMISDSIKDIDKPEKPDIDLEDPDVDKIIDDASKIEKPDMDEIKSSIADINGQMSVINGIASNATGVLASDIRNINAQITAIGNTISDAIANIENGNSKIIIDVSDANPDNITLGKISKCTNTGEIYGDLNVAGIAGSMAIDYELDPEDDIKQNLSIEERKQYEYMDIIFKCTNEGLIKAKRNYVGGISGYMNIGLVSDCENYGKILSESGSYAGGIAGTTASTIRNSFSKCYISASKYAGGITGCGIEDSETGNQSTICSCYAVVNISDCKQYYGAVSGQNIGSYINNYFLSDDLCGIDGVNIKGKAEPISYEDLCKIKNLPKQMTIFHLTFQDGDKILKTIDFNYGDSIDESEILDPPQKDRTMTYWDVHDFSNLTKDTIASAVYDTYITSIASDNLREDGRAAVLIEGEFSIGDSATFKEDSNFKPSDLNIYQGSLLSKLKAYFSNTGEGAFPTPFINDKLVEAVNISFSKDSNEDHVIRYLTPDGKTDKISIYIKNDDKWDRIPTYIIGSYICFNIKGNNTKIAAVETVQILWIIKIITVFIIAIVIAAIIILKKAKKSKVKDTKSDDSKTDNKEKIEMLEKEIQRLKNEDNSKNQIDVIDNN